jgi:hypothetical protein
MQEVEELVVALPQGFGLAADRDPADGHRGPADQVADHELQLPADDRGEVPGRRVLGHEQQQDDRLGDRHRHDQRLDDDAGRQRERDHLHAHGQEGDGRRGVVAQGRAGAHPVPVGRGEQRRQCREREALQARQPQPLPPHREGTAALEEQDGDRQVREREAEDDVPGHRIGVGVDQRADERPEELEQDAGRLELGHDRERGRPGRFPVPPIGVEHALRRWFHEAAPAGDLVSVGPADHPA